MRILFIISFLFLLEFSFGQISRIQLHDNWEFRQATKSEWMPAKVPGTVQEDLLRLGKIPDPHFGTNEDSIQWIENESWIYQTTFTLPDEIYNKKHHFLYFKGLDTYASIFLNDQKIGDTKNMFRSYEVYPGNKLRKENKLVIQFHSPIKKGKKILDQIPYKLPAGNDAGEIKVSPVVRKAGFHFGWDWGPRIVTSGIWKPIELVSFEENRIHKVVTRQEVNEEFGRIKQNLILHQSPKGEILKIYVENKLVEEKPLEKRLTSLETIIDGPELWWPHSHGKPHLYHIRLELIKDSIILDTWEKKLGFRTVELVEDKDDIGTSYYFKINGKPIYAKGANYIPQSHFTNSVTDEDYRRILESTRKANMNMIRVWGGGIYEKKIFYEICDELGLMVWQDFMFANTMSAYSKNVMSDLLGEVRENYIRLTDHASIVHWCGNNEINVAWFNWGWQNQYGYSKEDSVKLYNNYADFFRKRIPKLLETLDCDEPYSHTSPLSNWGKLENFNHSSMHYWGVFHGEDPFSEYAKYVGRFNSEYGFQSFPTWNTLQSFLPEGERKIKSKLLDKRQKSYKGNRLIYQHLDRHFPRPKDLKELSYLSQLTQRLGIGYAIQNHRVKQPHCQGTLYWQLNDCWPAISWSSIDHSGEYRALYYTVKKNLDDPSVFVEYQNNKTHIYVVCDTFEGDHVNLKLKLKNLSGKNIYQQTIFCKMIGPGVTQFESGELDRLIKKSRKEKLVLEVELNAEEKKVNRFHYFAPPKKLHLKKSEVKYELSKEKNGIRLQLESEKHIKNIWLQTSLPGNFSDNYFDMSANKTYTIFFETNKSLKDFKETFQILTLNDILNQRK